MPPPLAYDNLDGYLAVRPTLHPRNTCIAYATVPIAWRGIHPCYEGRPRLNWTPRCGTCHGVSPHHHRRHFLLFQKTSPGCIELGSVSPTAKLKGGIAVGTVSNKRELTYWVQVQSTVYNHLYKGPQQPTTRIATANAYAATGTAASAREYGSQYVCVQDLPIRV